MEQSFFIGIDGGATKCIVRMEDESGNLLGREISGPANINISVNQAWDSILNALKKIITPLNIRLEDKQYHFYAGMGLAGCEVVSAYQQFLGQLNPFKKIILSSDAHVACLGAHKGKDGAVIIIGTGSVGFQLESMKISKVSGWGFPHDDQGSGAWLGLQAIKLTLQSLDGRQPFSGLTEAIYTHFKKDMDYLLAWTNKANATAFAELAPIVIKQLQCGERTATELIKKAAHSINQIGKTLESARADRQTILPCALVGGIATYMEPFLDDALRARLVPCQLSPDRGAMLMIRKMM